MVVSQYWRRRVVPVAVLLLLLPVAITGLHHGGTAPTEAGDGRISPANLTVVTTQGTHFNGGGLDPSSGRLAGVRTSNGSVAWVHDRYGWYYDVDPVTNRTLLFVAKRYESGSYRTFAVEWNWVTNETTRRFQVPDDTHDVDRVGPHRYAVADKVDHRAFVYNYTADAGAKNATDEIPWQFRFREHFPPPPEAGTAGDYTHLNDVDVIDNGSTFVLSPRNFDRVVAVDRETKAVEWTLGEEDTPAILHEQHDPLVIETDPLTVLVGDSLNHRAVEYRRADGGPVSGEWERTWSYSGDLNWPRDVDRLPNGNTLITDTGNNRVVEVAPNGTVVWEYETAEPNPYDVERVHLGDEPKGPTMAEMDPDDTSTATSTDAPAAGLTPFKWTYRTGSWILPVWVGPGEFLALAAAVSLATLWLLVEGGLWVRKAVRARR